MITKIVSLLQQRKPNAPQRWVNILPQMARRLEDSLYRNALSIKQYSDSTTLNHRVLQLAMKMGNPPKPGANSANSPSDSNGNV